ncbi:DNA translocase FtsK [Xanthobacter sp. DSM 24535]|uniref:DNA translocase FtsK n=1 Tax=Roseixanthobacter psychrophilus TaxID=3119917 RepID=UPI00372ADB5B
MPSSNRPPRSFEPSFSAPARAGAALPPTRPSLPRDGAAGPTSPWVAIELVPSWLRPFTLDENTRFTRTPDLFLRPRRAADAPADKASGQLAEISPVSNESLPTFEPAAVAASGPTWRFLVEETEPETQTSTMAWNAMSEPSAMPGPQLPVANFDPISLPDLGLAVSAVLPGDLDLPAGVEEATDHLPVRDEGLPEAAPVLTCEVACECPPVLDAPMDELDETTSQIEPIQAPAHDSVSLEPGEPPVAVETQVPATLAKLARLIQIGESFALGANADQDLLPQAEIWAAATEAAPPFAVEAATALTSAEAVGDAPAREDAEARGEVEAVEDAVVLGDLEIEPVRSLPELPPVSAAVAASFHWTFPTLQFHPEIVPPAAPVLPQVVASEPPSPVVLPLLDAEEGELDRYTLPDLSLLREPPAEEPDFELSEEFLDQSSAILQQTLRDFGVRGEVIDANPGPVVTLYEFEPAPGTKSSRVIGLAADIARSMSAVSVRVAVVEGRNVIGIELPNRRRGTVWLRELLASPHLDAAHAKLAIALGKTIGGEPVIVDLARMPHLLVAGTTGSGKSVAINTMILSLLYRHAPEACRLIMIDPKMLELSVYEGIPHLLTPVVTDPKKAIIALKWAVREMEDRYKKMSRLGVRNIDGFNARMAEARAKGEVIKRQVQVGFDRETGEALFEEQDMDLSALPFIVIIVDEMADLMLTAGKEIEGAIQRLAQMARAAGIHLVMATQRPSVDVITGTIKANFPTRISFQVTSKIDSRTILGEMGAEQLLGQGDMLYMASGGRITRVHGPFVSDGEVEKVVAHLKAQGGPEYLDAVTSEDDAEGAGEGEDGAVFDKGALGEVTGDLYEQAVAIVLRDRKASTSYIQRRLQVGYNKAASLMERMETEGIVGPANHAGKREILSGAG